MTGALTTAKNYGVLAAWAEDRPDFLRFLPKDAPGNVIGNGVFQALLWHETCEGYRGRGWGWETIGYHKVDDQERDHCVFLSAEIPSVLLWLAVRCSYAPWLEIIANSSGGNADAAQAVLSHMMTFAGRQHSLAGATCKK